MPRPSILNTDSKSRQARRDFAAYGYHADAPPPPPLIPLKPRAADPPSKAIPPRIHLQYAGNGAWTLECCHPVPETINPRTHGTRPVECPICVEAWRTAARRKR